jgi:hypothetical protein
LILSRYYIGLLTSISTECILWYVSSQPQSARIASSVPESVANFNEQYTLDTEGKRVYTLKKVWEQLHRGVSVVFRLSGSSGPTCTLHNSNIGQL